MACGVIDPCTEVTCYYWPRLGDTVGGVGPCDVADVSSGATGNCLTSGHVVVPDSVTSDCTACLTYGPWSLNWATESCDAYVVVRCWCYLE